LEGASRRRARRPPRNEHRRKRVRGCGGRDGRQRRRGRRKRRGRGRVKPETIYAPKQQQIDRSQGGEKSKSQPGVLGVPDEQMIAPRTMQTARAMGTVAAEMAEQPL
jgi:hypothetical protein